MSSDETMRVLQRHGAAAAANDLDAIMADYAKDAVLISPPHGVLHGEEIRTFFEHPNDVTGFEVITLLVDDEGRVLHVENRRRPVRQRHFRPPRRQDRGPDRGNTKRVIGALKDDTTACAGKESAAGVSTLRPRGRTNVRTSTDRTARTRRSRSGLTVIIRCCRQLSPCRLSALPGRGTR